MRKEERSPYHAWIWDEVMLLALLGAALALFVTYPSLRNTYVLPEGHLVLETAAVLVCVIVSVLAAVRFSVDGDRLNLLLSCGFFVAGVSSFLFEIAPVVGGQPLHRTEAWAAVGGRLLAAAVIAAAPFARGRARSRRLAFIRFPVLALALFLLWLLCRSLDPRLPGLPPAEAGSQPVLLTTALGVQALLSLLALIGFGLRVRAHGEDLDRWLALAATLALFAELHYVFTPLLSSVYVSQGDFLRLLSYTVLLLGVWRAIRAAEFGRAVAEERARVAREIHDGLAQYLFAISTQLSLLERGGAPEQLLPRLREAAAAAQQETRFAVLALSSAGGTARFDAALRRYVDVLTADGELDVELEIDGDVHLGPDEQIEVFRIVQEGLANVRRHAHARRAHVRIGQAGGRRRVTIADDGRGFAEEDGVVGHGLRNIRARAAAIGGGFRLSSGPGQGTALEVTLRV